jgi:hypothetical protein
MFLRLKDCLIKEIKKIINRTKIIPVPNRKRIFIKRIKIIPYVFIYFRNIFKNCIKKLKSGVLSRTIIKWNYFFNLHFKMSRTKRRWTAINNNIMKFSKDFYCPKYFCFFFYFFSNYLSSFISVVSYDSITEKSIIP